MAQIEALTLASQALQSSMFQLAKEVQDPALVNLQSPAEATKAYAAQLQETYTQLQVWPAGLAVCLHYGVRMPCSKL